METYNTETQSCIYLSEGQTVGALVSRLEEHFR